LVAPLAADAMFRNLFGGGGGPGAGGFDFGDILGGGGKRARGGRTRKTAPPADVESDITVPFETAAAGGTVTITVGGRTIDVKVPAGIDDGKRLRVPASATGSADVYLKVHIAPHAFFKRDGTDVLLEVPISVPEAVLGTKVEVPTVGGDRLTVKVPPGTSSGSRIRLRGQGIAGGDQYLVVKIAAAAPLDDESRALIEQFAERTPQDPRANVLWK
ncbi:MAG: J domain-containing protein, partial [Fimbriiglobus sp.]